MPDRQGTAATTRIQISDVYGFVVLVSWSGWPLMEGCGEAGGATIRACPCEIHGGGGALRRRCNYVDVDVCRLAAARLD